MSDDSGLSACGRLVRRADPDRFLTALFAPPARREALFVLYALNHELARAREAAREPTLALIRLHWWREVVQGTAKRHEVATPLTEALAQGWLVPADLLAIIDGREAEVETAIGTRAEFLTYCAATAGGVMAAAGRALGAEGAVLERLRGLGTAQGMAGQLRNVPALAASGRVMLPQDVLGAHGVTIYDVTAGRGGPGLAAAMAALAGEAQGMLGAGRGPLPRAVIAAALPAVLARRDLARPALGRGDVGRGVGDRLAVLAAWARARV
jgi:phytoene synthase